MSKYFSENEIACKCGCGLVIHNAQLESIMDAIREEYGLALIANSWTRCPDNNAAEPDAKPDSAHLKGMAVDIRVLDSPMRYDILKIIFRRDDINRVGIARTFIHIDIDTSKPQEVVWLYG